MFYSRTLPQTCISLYRGKILEFGRCPSFPATIILCEVQFSIGNRILKANNFSIQYAFPHILKISSLNIHAT
jgi:hypothetical protein